MSKNVFSAILEAMERGEDSVLCYIFASSGSVPRGEGARMAVFAGGTEGTVGGGPVEFACIRMAREKLAGRKSGTGAYSLTLGKAASLGMVCGGDVEVCFWFIPADDAGARQMMEAELALEAADVSSWMVTQIAQGQVEVGLYDRENGLRFAQGIGPDGIADLAGRTSVLRRAENDDILYVEPLSRSGRVYIFGGGHVAKALEPVLHMVDFRTAVFEDRPEFVPEDGILGDFLDIGKSVQITGNDYVVIMTRGHMADANVLAQALRTDARYVGMIGSRTKIAATYERLRQQGFGDADFARLHSPIGLPIGGDTPAEIAISIAAEMIQHRAGKA